MEITGKLNREAAKAIFEQNAIFIDDRDVIPFVTAINLFGMDIVDRAWNHGKGGLDTNSWWVNGEKGLDYFYKHGFDLLVTYHNVAILCGEKEE